MNKELVSIITPNYNCEHFIAETIEGVINQTYQNWEMIIVDDCSTDNSFTVATDYAKKDIRIKVYKLDKNSGSPATPRNYGINRAQGRYIAFCDSDDIWLPNKLIEQISCFDEYTSVIYSNYEKINENSVRSNRIIKAPKHTTYKKMLKSNFIGNLTGIYDTNKIGKIYQKKIYHEDYVMWLEILSKGFIAKNTNSVLALYRITSDSVSSSKLKTIKWQLDIYRNELKLNIFQTIYYFIHYAIRAFIKFLK